jgi:DNA-binding response OmpR family regulator
MFETNNTKSQIRILIIDDDEELVESLKEVLVHEGYDVDFAWNGREGIRLQGINPYNLIITDIVMPEEDGLEVIMWVKSTHPNTKLIAISGGGYFDSREYLIMAKELGAKMVLIKPFEVAELKMGIKKLLDL